jgi:acyl phosphate:glycerol-3-phosphate acyltransferase
MSELIIAIIASYIIGSFPTAFVYGKVIRGVDIRKFGSGNIGATNAFRVLGKGPGAIVLLIDVLKGWIAVVWIGDILNIHLIILRVVLGLAVVCGHNWTIFLKFRGGKGIATSLGVLIGLSMKFPSLGPVLLTCVVIWGAVFFATRFVSLASLSAALGLPLAMLITRQELTFIALGVIFCLFIFFRHRANIRRLWTGTEHRISFSSSKKR